MGARSQLRPPTKYVAVTPSNTVNLPGVAIGFFVGTVGNVVVVGDDDVAVTLTAPALGVFHFMSVKRINATSTTAGAIVAGY